MLLFALLGTILGLLNALSLPSPSAPLGAERHPVIITTNIDAFGEFPQAWNVSIPSTAEQSEDLVEASINVSGSELVIRKKSQSVSLARQVPSRNAALTHLMQAATRMFTSTSSLPVVEEEHASDVRNTTASNSTNGDGDIWTDIHPVSKTGDEGFYMFKSAPHIQWQVLGATCIVMCVLDYCVFQSLSSSVKTHLSIVAFWLIVAACYNLWVWYSLGSSLAYEWCSGYVLEWMLSIDNLFVFHLIFQTYKTPRDQVHKALFLGICGAVLFRMVFYMAASMLLHLFHWIRCVFGLLLIWSGIEAARAESDDVNVEDTTLIRWLKWALGSRLSERYADSHALFVTDETRRVQLTLLFIVVACLEVTDIIFALDSVCAKVAELSNAYIAFSSSVLAMYGLRAMFFVMEDLVEAFDLLKYGICIILVFIGMELVFSSYIDLAASTVCMIILSVFCISIAGSSARNLLGAAKQALESSPDMKSAS